METAPIQTPSASAIFQTLPEDKVKIVAIHPILPYVLIYDEKKVSLVDYKHGRFLLSINPNIYSEVPLVGNDNDHTNVSSLVGHVKALCFYDQRYIQIVCKQYRSVLRSTSVQPPNWFIILCEHRILLMDLKLGTKNVHQILQDRDLQGHHPTSVTPLSPRLLAIGCNDGSIRIWDWLTKRCVRSLKTSGDNRGGNDNGDISPVTHLLNAYPDDGSSIDNDKFSGSDDKDEDDELTPINLRFISVNLDGSLRLWELISQGNIVHGPEPIKLGYVGEKGHGTAHANSVSYSALNDSIMALSQDGKTVIWNLSSIKVTQGGSGGGGHQNKGGHKPSIYEHRYPLIRIASKMTSGQGDKAYFGALLHDNRFPILSNYKSSSLLCAATKTGTLELFTTLNQDHPNNNQNILMPLISVELKKILPCFIQHKSASANQLKIYTMMETNHPRGMSDSSLIACGTNAGLCIIQVGKGRGFSQSLSPNSSHYHPLWSSTTWKTTPTSASLTSTENVEESSGEIASATSSSRKIIRYDINDHALYFSDIVPYPTHTNGSGDDANVSGNDVSLKVKNNSKIELDIPLYTTSFSTLSAHLLPVDSEDDIRRRSSSVAAADERGRSISAGTRTRGESQARSTGICGSLSLKPCIVPSIDGNYVAVHWPFTSVFQVYCVSSKSTGGGGGANSATGGSLFTGREDLRGRCLSLAWISPPPVTGSGLAKVSHKNKDKSSSSPSMHYDKVTLESSYLVILLEEAEIDTGAARGGNRRRTSSVSINTSVNDGIPKLSLRVYAFHSLLKGGIFSYALPVPANTAGIYGGGSVLFVNLTSSQLNGNTTTTNASSSLHSIRGDAGCSCSLFYLEIKPTPILSPNNNNDKGEEEDKETSSVPVVPVKVLDPSCALKPIPLQGAKLPLAQCIAYNMPISSYNNDNITSMKNDKTSHKTSTKNIIENSFVSICSSIGIFIYSIIPNKLYDKPPLLKLESFTSNLKFYTCDGFSSCSFIGNHSLIVSTCANSGNLYLLHLINQKKINSKKISSSKQEIGLEPMILHIGCNNPNELRSPYNHGYISSLKYQLNENENNHLKNSSSFDVITQESKTIDERMNKQQHDSLSSFLLPKLYPIPAGGSGGLLTLVAGQYAISNSTSGDSIIHTFDLSTPSHLLPLFLAAGLHDSAEKVYKKLHGFEQREAIHIYDRFGVDVPV